MYRATGLRNHSICLLLLLVLYIEGTSSNPVAVICPLSQSTDTVYFSAAGNFVMVETTEVSNAAYIWRNLTSTQPFILCGTPGTRLPLAGAFCSYGDTRNTTSVCFQDNMIKTQFYGHSSSLELPQSAQVTPCNSTLYSYLLSWSFQGIAQGQIAVAKSGCVAVSGIDISWFTRGLNASYDLSPQYAAVSGFPSSRLVGTANSSGTDQPSCSATANGYMTSLTAQYYAKLYETEQSNLPLSFEGAANVTRCSCLDESTAGQAWQGLPANYSSNFGARFSGEILVSEAEGASNDTLDWRLICLQHNDAALLMVDSILVLNMTAVTSFGAGYLESCKALQLDEGWHSVNVLYGSGANLQFSTLRLFVLSAEGWQIGNVQDEIIWEKGGVLCPIGAMGNATQDCNVPIDCCKLRTQYGCGSDLINSGSPLPVNLDPLASPRSSAVQYVLPPVSSIGSIVRFPYAVPVASPPPPPAAPPPPSQPSPNAAALPGSSGPSPIPAPSTAPTPSPALAPAATPIIGEQLPLVAINPLPLQPNASVQAPVQYTLPTIPAVPVSTGSCILSTEPCYLFTAGTGLHFRNAVLSCQTPLAAATNFQTNITYQTVNATQWLQATAVDGPSSLFNVIFRLAIDTSQLPIGMQKATLQVTGTDSNDQSVLVTSDILIVLAGSVQSNFSSIQRLQDNVAAVAATVSVGLPVQNIAVATNIMLSSSEGRESQQYQTNLLSQTGSLMYNVSSNISLPNPYGVPEPGVLLEASHEVSLSMGQYSTFVCGTLYSTAASIIPLRPQCGMTAVNMAYRGQQGFVTGSSEALLLLYCNVATKPCGGCFKLSGPPASNIEVLETGENTAGLRSTVYVSWQSDYQGSVSVSVDQSSRCQISSNPSLTFIVDKSLAVQPAGYEISDRPAFGWSET